MVKKHKKALFIFRRDLRLDDNLGLIEALKSSNSVIPCFILDPRQASPHDYFSENAFQFMVESLLDLKKQLREKNAGLYVFQGMAEEIVKYLLSEEKIDAVYFNCDYSPFSNKRDAAIGNICNRRQIEMLQFHDAFLNPPDYVLKDNGKPYAKFTPFHKKSQQFPISKPQKNRYDNYYRRQISINQQDILDNLVENPNERIHIHGGRGSALKILSKIREFENYEFQRDIPVLNATTSLSAHNKFGTVSINEVYYAVYNKLGEDHPLIRQLYWRDFFSYIGYFFPHVFGNSFHQKYDLIKWHNNKRKFRAWKDGKSGFPIVDAGMRQLNETGFMHNRVRMITASFLTKDLHVDWRWGEKYFAQKLVDYDPSVNNGNWQWSASTGCDAQPWFRIFNPWIQQKKYDPDCEYIKNWIPELVDLPSKIIHNWETGHVDVKIDYPPPIVDHKEESMKSKLIYKTVNI